ncbi:DUF4148 domain-containing protein [Variovorax sp. LT1R16]|uniref:DUF4148 domain-containing protein n=1 Tax=Variovorax sp. LT1R16 TaxID=3443728 RepID=UPI003F4685ED
MSTKFIAIAAVAAFTGLTGLSAQAFQGEQNNIQPQPFQSMRSRAEVAQEALKPVQITNGGTGVAKPVASADRAAVRAGARAIAANGASLYGT